MPKYTILIIDDEQNIRRTLKDILEDEGYVVFSEARGKDGLGVLSEEPVDLVLLDIKLTEENGLDVLRAVKEKHPEVEVVMISGHGTIEMAVEATKLGAYDFLEKPLSLERVKLTAARALEKKMLARKLEEKIRGERPPLLGEGEAMKALRKLIAQVAPTDSKVLISGESGTGKELVAREIHLLSARKDGPFVETNCAAIPGELIESELFGSEKGAYTGASQMRIGKFEQADGGTLFLDEVGDMSLNAQAKVLRVLEGEAFSRLGGNQTIKVDVRSIAATNKDLEKEVKEGRFREDLYFRLNVFPIRTPPLREHPEDIPLLADQCLERFARENGKPKQAIQGQALERLRRHAYPGNVRELKNLIERLAILASPGEITLEHVDLVLPVQTLAADPFLTARPLQEAKEDLERRYVEAQLKLHGGDIAKTAEALGLERTNLYRKLRQLGIEKE
jgi:two-component system, NtrC family, nitrogen regulation response regulator NtrX